MECNILRAGREGGGKERRETESERKHIAAKPLHEGLLMKYN